MVNGLVVLILSLPCLIAFHELLHAVIHPGFGTSNNTELVRGQPALVERPSQIIDPCQNGSDVRVSLPYLYEAVVLLVERRHKTYPIRAASSLA